MRELLPILYTCAESTHTAHSKHSYHHLTKSLIVSFDLEILDHMTTVTANHSSHMSLSHDPVSWCHKPVKEPGGACAKRLREHLLCKVNKRG